MIWFLFSLIVTDHEHILEHASTKMSDVLKLIEALTSQQAIISDHQELSHIANRLRVTKNKIDFLIYDGVSTT